MAGNGSRGGSGRSAGGSAAPKPVKAMASVSQAAFERRYQRAGKDVMDVRRYLANSDRPRYDQAANQRRDMQTNATSRNARRFYEGLRTDRATGMPQSIQAGFRNRERMSTGTKKKAGRKRSRMVAS